MILPTMTPEEKVRQMEKVKPFLNDAAVAWMNRNQKIVFKTKVFPTFYLFERNFDVMDETQTGLKVKLDEDNQLGAQQHNLKEQLSIRYKTDLDPFAPQDNRFELVEASTRGYGLKKEVNLQTDENRES